MFETAKTSLKFVEGQFFLENYSTKDIDNDQWVRAGPQLHVTTNIKAAAAFKQFSDKTCLRVFQRALNISYELPSLPPLSFLDPHQIEGVKWALTRKRSYLAHAPGAGKTVQAIVVSYLSLERGQTLIVVPPSLTENWKREIQKFSPEMGEYPAIAVVPVSAKKFSMNWGADFIICPDSMLWADWVFMKLRDLICNLKVICVDEASRLKEPGSKRSIAFYGGVFEDKRFHGLYQSARHVVFLDGSPMPNRPMELWAPVIALDPMAIDGMSQQDFGFRYCGASINARGQWEFKGSCREKELHDRLVRSLMHFAPEEQLSHPERRRSILFMNKDVRSFEQKTWERKHLPQLKLNGEETAQGELARFRRELGLRKINWIAEYVLGLLRDKKESILLFAWHREVCKVLAEKLKVFKPGLVMGGTPNETREKIFESFQTRRTRIIVGNIQAMGRGHNLQRADRVIFGEFSWTDELNKQCEKRASRRGREQSEFVRCEYVVCPDSIDEKVLSAVFTKEKRVRKIIG